MARGAVIGAPDSQAARARLDAVVVPASRSARRKSSGFIAEEIPRPDTGASGRAAAWQLFGHLAEPLHLRQ